MGRAVCVLGLADTVSLRVFSRRLQDGRLRFAMREGELGAGDSADAGSWRRVRHCVGRRTGAVRRANKAALKRVVSPA